MKKLYGLALLLSLPLLSLAQVRNTGVKLKGPIYADETLLITRNLLQVRVEAPFYIYSFANKSYDKGNTPVFLGLRYERLIKGKIGFGGEIESNSWDARVIGKTLPRDVPADQRVVRFTPYVKWYFRRRKKELFRGANLHAGLTILNTQQVVDLASTKLAGNSPYKFNSFTGPGLVLGGGLQHTFGEVVTIGASAEVIFFGQQFVQEGYGSVNIGNGAMFINPFKFYVGGRF